MIVAESAFPSGPLEAQHDFPIPLYSLSYKLEMILLLRLSSHKPTSFSEAEGALEGPLP